MSARLRISDEEYEAMAAEAHHDDLLSAVRELARNRPPDNSRALEAILIRLGQCLEMIAKKETSPDLRPLLIELSKSMKEIKQPEKPRSFRVERGKSGLIEKVVVETDRS